MGVGENASYSDVCSISFFFSYQQVLVCLNASFC